MIILVQPNLLIGFISITVKLFLELFSVCFNLLVSINISPLLKKQLEKTILTLCSFMRASQHKSAFDLLKNVLKWAKSSLVTVSERTTQQEELFVSGDETLYKLLSP